MMRLRSSAFGVVVLTSACGPTVAVGESGESGGASSDGATTTTATSLTSSTTTPSTSSTATTSLDGSTGEPCAAWASSGCAVIPSANAQTTGTTPLEITPPIFAVFAGDSGCGGCVVPNVAQIHLVSDLAELENAYAGLPPSDGAVLQLATDFGGFSGPIGQDVVGSITAYQGGAQVFTAATFYLETFPSTDDLAEPFSPEAPFVVRGRFAVDQPDWSLAGTFNAAYCPQLNLVQICE